MKKIPLIKFSIFKRMIIYFIEIILYVFTCIFQLSRKNTNKSNNSVLICEPFGLGDAISITCMIKPLISQGYKVYIICNNHWETLFTNNRHVCSVFPYIFPWVSYKNKYKVFNYRIINLFNYFNNIRRFNIDYGIDTRGDIRNCTILKLSGCKKIIGYDRYLNSNQKNLGLFLDININYKLDFKTRASKNLLLIKEAGLISHDTDLELAIPFDKIPEEHIIGFQFGAGWKYKHWVNEKWAFVIESVLKCNIKNKYKIHLIGHPSEEGIINNIIKSIKGENYEVILTEDLEDLCNAISRLEIFIGLDSGPMHVADAYNKKIITLFGPGILPLWKPNNNQSIVIENQDLFNCYPCNHINCIYPKDNCAQSIDEIIVLNTIKSKINFC